MSVKWLWFKRFSCLTRCFLFDAYLCQSWSMWWKVLGPLQLHRSEKQCCLLAKILSWHVDLQSVVWILELEPVHKKINKDILNNLIKQLRKKCILRNCFLQKSVSRATKLQICSLKMLIKHYQSLFQIANKRKPELNPEIFSLVPSKSKAHWGCKEMTRQVTT